ncbi:MAG: SsrA-binding protein SmpB [Chloroflexi bacterium]|jgi:SsrA-binding protein|nr:SsrA-binding protein SmpB [Chloroflexota bacterium]
MPESKIEIVSTNRKARHEYFIEDRYEAGIALKGTEIKSVRDHRVSLKEGYVVVRGGELWLMDVHIAPYQQAGIWTHNPKRPRKLLMHRREIDRIERDVNQKGYTIVPLKMYIVNDYAKVEIGIARGKRKYDKRAAIAKRDANRRVQRELKEFKRRGYQEY